MNSHSEEIKKEIVDHCYEKFKTINKDFLKSKKIRNNLFLEVLYEQSIMNYRDKGDYNISDEDLKYIFSHCRMTTDLMIDYIEDRAELIGINEEDHLIFRIKKLIQENNDNE